MLAQALAALTLVFPLPSHAAGGPITTQPDGSIVLDGVDRIDPFGRLTEVNVPLPAVPGIEAPRDVRALPGGGWLAIDDEGALWRVASDGRRSELSDSANSLSPAPDGSVLFADTMANEVRRVAPDGTVTTLIGSTRAHPCDGTDYADVFAVLALPDGRVLFGGSQLYLYAGGKVQALSCGRDPFGLGGPLRQARPAFTDLARAPDGGVLAAGQDGLLYIAPPVPSRLAVAVPRATLRTARAGRVEVVLTASATVTVDVAGAHVTATLPAGTSSVRVPRLGAKVYTVRVSATDAANRVASASLRVVGSARLPVALGRRIIRRQLTPDAGLGPCRAANARTVVCGKRRITLLRDGRLRYRGQIVELY